MLMVRTVIGGVDTNADVHVAAAVDGNGGVLGIEAFPADAAGYQDLLRWLTSFGPVCRVGVEGTGSYGVGLARFLHAQGGFVAHLEEKGLAASTIRQAYLLVAGLFASALDSDLIVRTPCRGIKLPPKSQTEMRFLNADEVPTSPVRSMIGTERSSSPPPTPVAGLVSSPG